VQEHYPSEQHPSGRGATPGMTTDRQRRDVSLLGGLVGEVLREQGGDALFGAVEHLRREAIALRATPEPDPAREAALREWVEGQSDESLLAIVRGFSVYFHVINLAEQHHRVRVLRERERAGGTLQESVGAAIDALREAGVDAPTLAAGLDDLLARPVFTAHPSEARRRTLRYQLLRAAAMIARPDDTDLLPRERTATLDELRARITLIWETAATREAQPSVLDEVQSVLGILAGTLYDVAPLVGRTLEGVVAAAYPTLAPQAAATAIRWLRPGTWVGGDRDGHPGVTPDITRAAARLSRAAALRRYREDVRALGLDLSISARLTGAAPALLDSLARDRAALGVQPVRRWQDEPYRRKCGLIGERLRRTEEETPGGYAGPDELQADLALIAASLAEHGGARIAAGGLRDLRDRVVLFGFHLAELEIRQHADRYNTAVAELFGLAGTAGYAGFNEDERLAALEASLAAEPFAHASETLTPRTREILDTFRAIADIQADW